MSGNNNRQGPCPPPRHKDEMLQQDDDFMDEAWEAMQRHPITRPGAQSSISLTPSGPRFQPLQAQPRQQQQFGTPTASYPQCSNQQPPSMPRTFAEAPSFQPRPVIPLNLDPSASSFQPRYPGQQGNVTSQPQPGVRREQQQEQPGRPPFTVNNHPQQLPLPTGPVIHLPGAQTTRQRATSGDQGSISTAVNQLPRSASGNIGPTAAPTSTLPRSQSSNTVAGALTLHPYVPPHRSLQAQARDLPANTPTAPSSTLVPHQPRDKIHPGKEFTPRTKGTPEWERERNLVRMGYLDPVDTKEYVMSPNTHRYRFADLARRGIGN